MDFFLPLMSTLVQQGDISGFFSTSNVVTCTRWCLPPLLRCAKTQRHLREFSASVAQTSSKNMFFRNALQKFLCIICHLIVSGRWRINAETFVRRSTVVKKDTASRDIVHGSSRSKINGETIMRRSTVGKTDNSAIFDVDRAEKRGFQHVYKSRNTSSSCRVQVAYNLSGQYGYPWSKQAMKRDKAKKKKIDCLRPFLHHHGMHCAKPSSWAVDLSSIVEHWTQLQSFQVMWVIQLF